MAAGDSIGTAKDNMWTRRWTRSCVIRRPQLVPTLLTTAAALADARGEVLDLVVDLTLFGELTDDLLVRMQHGRVVPAAEDISDLGQRKIGELPDEIHGDLTSLHGRPGPVLRPQIVD